MIVNDDVTNDDGYNEDDYDYADDDDDDFGGLTDVVELNLNNNFRSKG